MEQEIQNIEKMRHTASHVLAQAVLKLYPDTKLGIGPAIDNGFYYDFKFSEPLTDENLKPIQKEMQKIVNRKLDITQSFMSKKEAIKLLKGKDESFKLELLEGIEDKEVSFFTTGEDEFSDLCRGPHVENTGDIKAFKITHLAGAYWKGSEENEMLTRIYGVAFDTKEELKEYFKLQEENKKRDHRKLGKQLDIYSFHDEVGPGLPLWHPNGTVIIEELETLAKKLEREGGYKQVKTPHLTKEDLFIRSGHLPYYEESMYPSMEIDGSKYYVKPMNCPFHHKIYSSQIRSYRDLPVRLSEYGTCYRYEKSGELFGLMRVRSMQMNDAHIYVSEEQFADEFLSVIDLYMKYFEIFGIDKYQMRLSTHSKEGLGKKYVDNETLWIKTEDMVRKAMNSKDIPYVEVEDEAAFYGPKIDVQVWSAIGKEFTLATNQVDFSVPEKFNLEFVNKEGEKETPLCIHRAPLSTHERMIGFLLEHFAGVFPTWLSPLQVKVVPIAQTHNEYAQSVKEELLKAGVRVEVDDRSDNLGTKIRKAEVMKVPYVLVIGDKEIENKTVSVRARGLNDQGMHKVESFVEMITKEIKEYSLNLTIK